MSVAPLSRRANIIGLWEHYQKSKKQRLHAQKVPDGSEWDDVAQCHQLFVPRESSRPSLPTYKPLFQAAQACSITTHRFFTFALRSPVSPTCIPFAPLPASPTQH